MKEKFYAALKHDENIEFKPFNKIQVSIALLIKLSQKKIIGDTTRFYLNLPPVYFSENAIIL